MRKITFNYEYDNHSYGYHCVIIKTDSVTYTHSVSGDFFTRNYHNLLGQETPNYYISPTEYYEFLKKD